MKTPKLTSFCGRLINRIDATCLTMRSNFDVMASAAKGHIFVNLFKFIRATMPFLTDVLNLTPLINAIKDARNKDVPVLNELN